MAWVFLAAMVATGSLLGAPATAGGDATLDASGLPVPAWQADPELGRRWRQFTGRYIYQRACLSCHDWGPERLSRGEWEAYLAAFPGNHEPDVSREYADLTARFSPGRMVPDAEERRDALAAFLLAAAPPEADREPVEPWDGLPRVGDPVPDFRLVDLAGGVHTPARYRGERALVLVFSRAHW